MSSNLAHAVVGRIKINRSQRIMLDAKHNGGRSGRAEKARTLRKADRRLMPIKEHPFVGSILLCDFNSGFREPEMVKRRPVVVLSPKIAARPGLCTVVALSETEPHPRLPYHCQIDIRPKLPDGFNSDGVWVKGDMIYAVGFTVLTLSA